MFSQVSVCPQGECLSPLHAGIHAPPPRQTPPGQTPPCPVHAGIRSTSGRYASHWNAFLVNDVVSQWLTFITLISISCERHPVKISLSKVGLVMCGVQIAPTSRFYKCAKSTSMASLPSWFIWTRSLINTPQTPLRMMSSSLSSCFAYNPFLRI